MFLDSSVFLAASLSPHGAARDLVLAGIRGQLGLIVSPLVLAETERNLSKKAPEALPAFTTFTQVLGAEIVTPSAELVDRVALTIDPKDAPIVAAAIAAQVAFLATYDRRHLLSHAQQISGQFGIVVATPDTVLRAVA